LFFSKEDFYTYWKLAGTTFKESRSGAVLHISLHLFSKLWSSLSRESLFFNMGQNFMGL